MKWFAAWGSASGRLYPKSGRSGHPPADARSRTSVAKGHHVKAAAAAVAVLEAMLPELAERVDSEGATGSNRFRLAASAAAESSANRTTHRGPPPSSPAAVALRRLCRSRATTT
jgi:hypothetical protein